MTLTPPPPCSADDVVIDVRNVSKCYQLYARPRDRLLQSLFRGRKTFYRDFWALSELSLQVRRGEAVGIIGRNGAGKSTLLQLIAGTLTPTTGEVVIRGRVAALLQLGSGFNPEFSGRENVFLNGAILGFSRTQMEARFEQIAAFADIGYFIEQPVKTYSSGMVMRLAFAVSVCLEPEILIVDEALAVGDAPFQFRCRERLTRLLENGSTLLFVSHDIGLVKSLCNKAVYLAESRLVAEGEPGEIAEQYQLENRRAELAYAGLNASVQEKPRLNPDSPVCFGTDEGQILGAAFTQGGLQGLFQAPEAIEFAIECALGTGLQPASLAVYLQTTNLIQVGGLRTPLDLAQGRVGADGRRHFRVSFSLPSGGLSAGQFFITVVLEERLWEGKYRPLEKQPGLLSFKLENPRGHDFLPSVDLTIRAHIQSGAAAHSAAPIGETCN